MVGFFLPIVKTQCGHLQLDQNQECNPWKSSTIALSLDQFVMYQEIKEVEVENGALFPVSFTFSRLSDICRNKLVIC